MEKYKSLNKCLHKWKYIGIYDGGYYNHKECIYCSKLEIEKSKKNMVKLTKLIKEVLSEKQLINNFKKWIGKNNHPTVMDIDWYAEKENLTPEQKSVLKKIFPPDNIKIKSTGPTPDDVRFRNK